MAAADELAFHGECGGDRPEPPTQVPADRQHESPSAVSPNPDPGKMPIPDSNPTPGRVSVPELTPAQNQP